MFKKKNKDEDVIPTKKKPKKKRWYHQVWEIYKITQKDRPLIWLWMLLIVVGAVLIGIVIGQFIWKDHTVFLVPICFLLGVLGAMITLTRNAEAVTYANLENQQGASYAGLQGLKRGWRISEEPVAVNKKGPSFIFRAIGRPGVVLVCEGSYGVLKQMIAKERIKINRIAPKVPITVIVYGNGQGQTPLREINKKIKKLPNKLTKIEASGVMNRLESFGGLSMNIPKGIDPLNYKASKKIR